MSRILVLLSHRLHVRNFLASGCLQDLAARGHALTLVLPGALVTETTETFDLSRVERVLPMEPYLGGRSRQRVRASLRVASFVQRERFKTYGHKIRLNRRPWFRTQVALYRALGSRYDLEERARAIEARLAPRPAAEALVADVRPDLFFYPTLIHEGTEIELLKAARRRGVPAVAFAASWDTLTSKGFFLVPPDHLLVWGEENRRQAFEHHRLTGDRVAATGAPHLDVYGPRYRYESRDDFLLSRGLPPARRVILFAGTTITYWEDEPRQLAMLSGAIESGELPGCVVWYRSHPRRPLAQVAGVEKLPGVFMDDQVARQKSRGGSYSMRGEDLVHYRSLMNAVAGVVTAFSTMIIEAALLGRPSLVVGFGVNDRTPARLVEHSGYEHMQDVLRTPGVTLCRSAEDLLGGVKRLLAGDFASHAEGLRRRAGQIANNLDGRARERIIAALEAVAARGRLP
jgi:hypothetical protein